MSFLRLSTLFLLIAPVLAFSVYAETNYVSGSAAEELVVAYGDEAMEIGFNARYLLEIASQVDRENAVFMFADANAPTLVREGDDASAVYVVMPMRV